MAWGMAISLGKILSKAVDAVGDQNEGDSLFKNEKSGLDEICLTETLEHSGNGEEV